MVVAQYRKYRSKGAGAVSIQVDGASKKRDVRSNLYAEEVCMKKYQVGVAVAG